MRQDNTPNAFSFVALVGIAALYAAVVLPALARAGDDAKKASCLANIRQLSAAIRMYAQDNDDRLPFVDTVLYERKPSDGGWGHSFEENGKYYWVWHELVYPYYKDAKIQRCPGSDAARPDFPPYRGHYGSNSDIMADSANPGKEAPLSKIEQPGKRILIMDAGTYNASKGFITDPHGNQWYIPGTRPELDPAWINRHDGENGMSKYAILPKLREDFTAGRHNGGVVIGFADGHAGWMKGTDLTAKKAEPWCPAGAKKGADGKATWYCL